MKGGTMKLCRVFPPGPYKPYNVKNLGWLLRRTQDVVVKRVLVDLYPKDCEFDAALVVFFEDGTTFVSGWADRTILHEWLKHHRALRDAPRTVDYI
jgi:hypothetical protein